MAVMAVSLAIAMGSSAFAAAVDTFPQWGPNIVSLAARVFSDQSRVPNLIFRASRGFSGLSPTRLDTSLIDRALVSTSSSPAGNFYVALSALLSASGICCAAVITHGLGGRMKYRHLAWMFFQPFVGGVRFILMQAMAWTLFAFSLLVFSSVACVAAFIGRALLGQGLLASAGVTGLASEFLLIASLLIFESPGDCPRGATAPSRSIKEGFPSQSIQRHDANGRSAKKPILATRESAGTAESAESAGREETTAAESETAARNLYREQVEAHGETGSAVQGRDEKEGSARVSAEKGEMRVVCPAPWTARQLALATRNPAQMLPLLLASALGKTGRRAEGIMGEGNGAEVVETMVNRNTGEKNRPQQEMDGGGNAERSGKPASDADSIPESLPLLAAEESDGDCRDEEGRDELRLDAPVTAWEVVWWCWVKARALFSVCFMYAIQHALAISICMPALCCEVRTAVPVYAGVLAAFVYCNVCGNNRERNGKSHWLWLQPYCIWLLEECSAAYFNAVRIVREGDASLYPADQRYIFTYHPHGLIPAIMAWFFHTSAWAALLPGIRPVALVASVLFRVPLLRQLCLWGGLREVSREGFKAAIHDQQAAIVCPGGQSELSYHGASSERVVVLCARKVGFVRMAVETRSLLVPIFCFGEAALFDNIFHMPSLQRFTYRRFGFPIPFLPIGLFGLLPLPRTAPVTLVVGRPFDPTAMLPTSLDPGKPMPLEHLQAIRDRYYEEVQALFERHKARWGMEDVQLELRQ
ncbi:hypothetical protein CLOM_g7441 [Closterium sp. NIES-68]|nr:hypothetical protein CLOM_g7441 [Closterium sp. NIES-68]GJP81031.1 hypothetical protein CLOP_g11212 [Closterium sp. NIES-67]